MSCFCVPSEAYLLASSSERIRLGDLLVARGAGSESQHLNHWQQNHLESFGYIGPILIIHNYTVLYGIRYTSNYVNRFAIEASPLCMQFTRVAQACRIGRIRRHLWHASDAIPNLRQHRAQWRVPNWIPGDGHSSHPDPRGHRYVQHHKVGDPMASRNTWPT